jgi:alpha-tubulin suppressor-like RCC1 family protein
VTTSYEVLCWGDNAWGQLGRAISTAMSGVADYPQNVSGQPYLLSANGLALGDNHSCALDFGAVSCWGANDRGQLGDGRLGDGTTPAAPQPVPRRVVASVGGPAFQDAATIASAPGANHTCVSTYDSIALCWGSNAQRQVGDGTLSGNKTVPMLVQASTALRDLQGPYDSNDPTHPWNAAVRDVAAVAVGAEHSCANRYGALACWGANAAGQLGDDSTNARATAVVSAADLGGIAAVAGGGLHTCAALEDDSVSCWGAGASGQLGNGLGAASKTPVAVASLPAVAKPDSARQVVVPSLTLGALHACAVSAEGVLWCWGSNASGELGDGTRVSRALPVPVSAVAP